MKIIVVSDQQTCKEDLIPLLKPLKKYHMPYAIVETPNGAVLIRKPMDYEIDSDDYKGIIVEHDQLCYDLSSWDGTWEGGE